MTQNNRTKILPSAAALFALLLAPTSVHAAGENDGTAPLPSAASGTSGLNRNPLNGPDSASSLIREGREEKSDVLDQNILEDWEAWKADFAEKTGLSLGADYTAVGFAATSSPGDDTAASGIARLFGSWELVNRGGPNSGSLEFKVEHRHAYTDVSPVGFGFEVGYAGLPEPVFSDQGFRTTTLFWKQRFLNDRGVARVGFIDVKDYFDVYPLASPWAGFHNLAFSTGVGTMSLLPDGAFGAMAGLYLTDDIYAATSIADASGDPTSIFDGFDTFFGDFDTFKTFEIGMTGGGKRFFLDNAHLALWHIDESEANGTPGGRGAIASVSTLVDDNMLAFLRAAWGNGGAGILEASVSTGIGYQDQPGGNLLGVGLNWGRPSSKTFGTDLNDQWTGEVFYRVQLTENIQIAPSAQLLANPALNPDEDFIAIFGLRTRLTL